VVALSGVAVVGVATNLQSLVLRSNSTLESLTHWQTDSRLLNRFDTYRQANDLIQRRPFSGWGPGSAADTFDRYFRNGVHVTPHNLLLVYAVEAGVLAALVVAGMIATVAVVLARRSSMARAASFGLAALVAFLVFGATGSAVDAAPVSSMLLFLVGLGTAQTTPA
jgi:O-antigen ligase